MSSEVNLTVAISQSGHVTLAGSITHETVLNVLDENILSSNSSVVVSFDAVNHSDSSGLALMSHWARQARHANVEICFEHVPHQLVALAKMSGLDTVLSIVVKKE